jgi:hypothetical protein
MKNDCLPEIIQSIESMVCYLTNEKGMALQERMYQVYINIAKAQGHLPAELYFKRRIREINGEYI